MKLSEIIKKALKGEELNALEKAELERFDPDALTQRAADAETQLKEAREKLDAAEQDKMTEAEKFKKRAEQAEAKLKTSEEARRAAEADRDEAKRQHAALVRNNRIAELAAKHKCEDAEYLDFLAEKRGVDINDDAESGRVHRGAEKGGPEVFRRRREARARALRRRSRRRKSRSRATRIGSIIESLNNAPEIQ